MEDMEMEEDLKSLLKGEHSTLCLSFNEYSANEYQTVKEFYEQDRDWRPACIWVSDDERERAIKNNSMWVLRFYPENKNSGYLLAASSVEALLNHAKQLAEKERKRYKNTGAHALGLIT